MYKYLKVLFYFKTFCMKNFILAVILILISSCSDNQYRYDETPTHIYITFTNQEGIPIDKEGMHRFTFNGNLYPNGYFSIISSGEYHILNFSAHRGKLNRVSDFEMPNLNYKGSFSMGEIDNRIYLQFEEQTIYPDENIPYGSFVIPLPL